MLSYDMGERGNASRYDYLYRCIRHDIAHGNILPDEKLPSKRALARNIGVSVITVEAAYSQLIAEGYVRAEERRGYFACELSPVACEMHVAGGVSGCCVSGNPATPSGPETCARPTVLEAPAALAAPEAPAPFVSPKLPAALAASESPAAPASLSSLEASAAFEPHASLGGVVGATAFAAPAATAFFPYQTWARVMRQTLTEESSATLAEAALAAGSPRLRRAIASYLREYRGLDVPARRIVVAAGSQTLYQLIVQLFGRGRSFAVEQPGYSLLKRVYDAQNVRCAGIELTEGGIDVAALRVSGASVAHVMPAHQFPTGAVMSAACRRDLLNWSREGAFEELLAVEAAVGSRPGEIPREGALEGTCASGDEVPRRPASLSPAPLHPVVRPKGRFIIEDDYDAEFRMAGRPIAPIASVDTAGRVIYLNSFTKSLGAAFRIAYMVLPESLIGPFARNLGFYSNTVSPLEQLALARFIEKGHYERHVNRLRTRAKRTQDAVVEKLKTDCASGSLVFTGLDGGFHFSVRLEAKGALSCADVERDFLRSARECGVRVSAIDEVGRYLVNYEQAIVQGGLR